MDKKEFSQSAMSELMGGLVTSNSNSNTSPAQQSKKNLSKKIRICTNLSEETAQKLSVISMQLGIPKADIYQRAIDEVIFRYECRFGPINIPETPKVKKKDINMLF